MFIACEPDRPDNAELSGRVRDETENEEVVR